MKIGQEELDNFFSGIKSLIEEDVRKNIEVHNMNLSFAFAIIMNKLSAMINNDKASVPLHKIVEYVVTVKRQNIECEGIIKAIQGIGSLDYSIELAGKINLFTQDLLSTFVSDDNSRNIDRVIGDLLIT